MPGRIVILTGGHLCHNPRVIKEATALCSAGFNVEVLGGWFDADLKKRDQELMAQNKFRYRPVHDLTEEPARRLWLRFRGRLAKEIHARTGKETSWQLGYFVSALNKAVQNSKADLFIAHSEQALFAVSQLLKSEVRKPRIGVDMEDWFSEDLPPETRRQRPVQMLRNLERTVLRGADYSACTSKAMSEALMREYGCQPPAVIYNVFPWADRANIDGQYKDRRNRSIPSVHWYSQTLGTDRGLSDLFAALSLLEHEVEIHLRGKPVAGFDSWLEKEVSEKWRHHIFIHDLVSNDELLSRIAEHDIGFAGEIPYCKNKIYTVSNKILHYLLGGLAVVASDTAGHCEIAGQAGYAVRVYPSGDSNSLGRLLNELLNSREKMSAAKTVALCAAEGKFCWERQASVLVESVKTAISA